MNQLRDKPRAAALPVTHGQNCPLLLGTGAAVMSQPWDSHHPGWDGAGAAAAPALLFGEELGVIFTSWALEEAAAVGVRQKRGQL